MFACDPVLVHLTLMRFSPLSEHLQGQSWASKRGEMRIGVLTESSANITNVNFNPLLNNTLRYIKQTNPEFLFCTFNICSSTSFMDIMPLKMAATVRYLPWRGSQAAIMFLASNIYNQESIISCYSISFMYIMQKMVARVRYLTSLSFSIFWASLYTPAPLWNSKFNNIIIPLIYYIPLYCLL